MIPYLATGHGPCSETLSNCRTLAYLRNGLAGAWDLPHDGRCPVCCCPIVDDGDYTFPGDEAGNPAPWYTPTNPASGEALGLMLDHDGFDLESSLSARVQAEGGPVLLTLSGTVIAQTRRGLNYYLRWLRGRLESCCGGACDGVQLSFFEHCTDGESCPTAGDFDLDPERLVPEEEATIIDDLPTVQGADTGERTVLRVRLRSISPIEGGSTRPCEERIVIVFEVQDQNMLGCPLFSCVASQWDEDWCEPSPPEPEDCPEPSCAECGTPCRCLPESERFEVGDGLPNVSPAAVEPSPPEPQPKPIFEPPPPPCSPEVDCALELGHSINSETLLIEFDSASKEELVNLYLQCIGQFPDIEAIIEACDGATDLVTEVENGVVSYIPMIGGNRSPEDCWVVLDSIPGIGEPFEADDLACIREQVYVRPFLDGEPLDESLLFPFPLEYNGALVADGPAFAAALSAERGCPIQWIPPSDPDNPCTYCIPPGCARREVASLDSPAICIQPTVDGSPVRGLISWPMNYNGAELGGGDALAAALSAARGCSITWDEAAQTYCVPADCTGGPIVNLTSPGTESSEIDCFGYCEESIRQACLIPKVSRTLSLGTVIRLSNGALPIENAVIRIYEWIPGLPHILNQAAGAPAYHSVDPAFEYQIPGLPAFSDLYLDGRNGKLRLRCADGTTRGAGGVVFGPNRSPARPPKLRCVGYWVELSLCCDTSSEGNPSYGALDQVLAVDGWELIRP